MALDQKHESLAEIPEGDLVSRLLADAHWKHRILDIRGIPDGIELFPERTLAPLAKGDVDILGVSKEVPECATAIQVKRVRVSERSFSIGARPNKLTELPKLMRQASLLTTLGFWQVYAFVFVVVDARSQNPTGLGYEGLTSRLRRVVEDALTPNHLHPAVGLMVYEFTQTMNHAPLSTGTFSGRLVRLASSQAQAAAVTDWVRVHAV